MELVLWVFVMALLPSAILVTIINVILSHRKEH